MQIEIGSDVAFAQLLDHAWAAGPAAGHPT